MDLVLGLYEKGIVEMNNIGVSDTRLQPKNLKLIAIIATFFVLLVW